MFPKLFLRKTFLIGYSEKKKFNWKCFHYAHEPRNSLHIKRVLTILDLENIRNCANSFYKIKHWIKNQGILFIEGDLTVLMRLYNIDSSFLYAQ